MITLVSFYDTGNIALSCAYIMFIDSRIQNYMIINFGLSLFGGIMFVLMVPESPKFLLMKNPNSQRAIKILNYIAWFNGCKERIQEGAMMDTEQQLRENKDLL